MSTFIPDISNTIFQFAADLVNQTSRNIFLTGKAGTGKTTFLKFIRENCPKQIAVVAPTGVAAINAGGVTIHSFFQLPFSPFVPATKTRTIASAGHGPIKNNDEVVNPHSLLSHQRMTSEKKKVLRQLELLVIDEISMVRCDTLDAIDTVLRHVRGKPFERFGGVQVLFIGDMFQLPPVIKEQEWSLLSDFYDSPYFFESSVIKEDPPVFIEFMKIYRQSDEQFIHLLNQVRNNELNEEGMQILESRFNPSFRRKEHDGYIILTTHNEKSRNINAAELKSLESRNYTFQAEIEDDFSENAYPADEILHLKEGAQVMFIKNDTDKNKRYFNGKIGIVTKLDAEKIYVQCNDQSATIEVRKEKWENIRYTLNKTTRQLEEEVLGSFSQYPLRLAWAITIHKSQGLTFEKAIIDAGEAFAPGQVYVALSRCTNLEGMVLQSRVRSSSLSNDEKIVWFSQKKVSISQLQQELVTARNSYEQSVILSIYNFRAVSKNCKEVEEYLLGHKSSFNPEAFTWIGQLMMKLTKLEETGVKFRERLKQLFHTETPESKLALEERLNAAASYFKEELSQILQYLSESQVTTDSRIHAKEFNEGLKELWGQLTLIKFLLEGNKGPFDINVYHRRKREFILPAFTVNAYAGAAQPRSETSHPVLRQQLRKLRDSICAKKDLPIYIIAGTRTIDEMAEYLPLTIEDLEKISGFGKVKIEKYGQQFLEIIQQYCQEHALTTRISDKSPKRVRKEPNQSKGVRIDTKAETYKLYKEGMAVAGIAQSRNLTVQTIEGHLAHYIQKGDINIEELLSREKLLLIAPALDDFNGGSITPIKEKLGNVISFSEIKLVVAWKEFMASKAEIIGSASPDPS